MRVYNVASVSRALQDVTLSRVKISTLKDLNYPFDLYGYELTTRGKRTRCPRFVTNFTSDLDVISRTDVLF